MPHSSFAAHLSDPLIIFNYLDTLGLFACTHIEGTDANTDCL